MARTRSRTSKRSSSRNGKGPKVAFTRNASERNVGGGKYLRLDDDEKFVGYALFDPDPAAEDNPGYVEYGEHYDQKANRFVPCWGIKKGCIFCKAGAQASQRAMTAFLVTSINGDDLEEPEIKLFRMNWMMIQEWNDTLDEDGSTLGQKVRIKCQSRADGDYITKFYDKDRLTKKDIKAALKDVPDIEEELQKNLNRALENLRVQDVLEEEEGDEDDDEDEDEEETPKNKSKSRSKKKDEEEEEDDEDDDEEDDDEEESDEEDEEDEEESDEDDDEESEDDEDEDEEESEDEEEADEDESLEGDYTVVSTSESEMTFTLKELDSDVYIGQEIADEVEFDEFKKGDKVHIVAGQDDDDDWVATEITKIKKSGKDDKKKKTSSKKKR